MIEEKLSGVRSGTPGAALADVTVPTLICVAVFPSFPACGSAAHHGSRFRATNLVLLYLRLTVFPPSALAARAIEYTVLSRKRVFQESIHCKTYCPRIQLLLCMERLHLNGTYSQEDGFGAFTK